MAFSLYEGRLVVVPALQGGAVVHGLLLESVALGSLFELLARRRVGWLPLPPSLSLRLFSMRARRALTSSNSEVVTTYSARAAVWWQSPSASPRCDRGSAGGSRRLWQSCAAWFSQVLQLFEDGDFEACGS